MTFWTFLDRQLARLTPSGVAGAGIFVLTGIVLAMLYADRTLADNDLFKTLAQAIIVQGLVGLAMAAWFTKKPQAEETTPVQVMNDPRDPVPTSPVDDASA